MTTKHIHERALVSLNQTVLVSVHYCNQANSLTTQQVDIQQVQSTHINDNPALLDALFSPGAISFRYLGSIMRL